MDNVDTPETAEPAEDPKKKKRDKVRSAWISFAGRIVAQIVGAIATVALGVMVLHRYTSVDTPPPASELRQDVHARPAAPPPVHVIVLTPGMLGLGAGGPFTGGNRIVCSPGLDGPPTSAAHLDHGTLLSR
jgi:hypothetical protein